MNHDQQKPLSAEHIQRLQAVVQGHPLEALITLALATGMRRDELLRLHWQDIDLERGEVRVQETKIQRRSHTIRIPENVVAVLKQYRQHQMKTRLAEGSASPDHVLVFSDLAPTRLAQEFGHLVEQAGLPRVRFHDLRVAWWWTQRDQRRAVTEGESNRQGTAHRDEDMP